MENDRDVMNRVFISYSRKNSDFVKRLHQALSVEGRDVWVDWEDIPPSAEWEKEIHHGINQADAVICVLSADFLASKVCNEELQLAIKQHKRLTPIVCEDISYQQVMPDLASLNWIFLRPEDDFSVALEKIVKALDTNLDHVQKHTRLLIRAEEWRTKDFNHSYFLRGSDLTDAETWLREAVNEKPRPAPLHTDYVLRSRRASERRKRNFFMRIMVGVLLISVAAIVAYFQYQEKQEQRQIAEARSLINQATNLRSDAGKYIPTYKQLTRSLELSVHALEDYQQLGVHSVSADQSTRESLSALPEMKVFGKDQQFHLGEIQDFILSVRRGFLAFAHDSRSISIWDVKARAMRAEWMLEMSEKASIKQLAISADGQYVASLSHDSTQKYASILTLWQLTQAEEGSHYPYQAQALFSIKRSGQSRRFSFSADGHYLLLQNAKGYWEGWRIKGTQRTRLLWLKGKQQKDAKLDQLQVSPDSQRIAGVQFYGRYGSRYIVQYDLKNGTELASWTLENELDTLRWTADSESILLEMEGYFLQVSAKSGRLSAVHRSPILNAERNQVAILASNAVGAGDQILYSIDVTQIGSQRKLFRFPHSEEPDFFNFLPDNKGLIALQGRELYYWAFDDTAAYHVLSPENDLKQADKINVLFPNLVSDEASENLIWTTETDPKERKSILVQNSQGLSFSVLFDAPVEHIHLNAETQELVVVSCSVIAGAGCAFKSIFYTLGDDFFNQDNQGKSFNIEALMTTSMELAVTDNMPTGLDIEAYISLLGFSPDNRFLLTAEREGFVLIDKNRLEIIRSFSHTDPKAFAFSADGRLLVTSAADWHLRIWQVDTGEEIIRIPRRQTTQSLHISPDNQWLLVREETGHVRIWALSTKDLLEQACQRLDPTAFACQQ